MRLKISGLFRLAIAALAVISVVAYSTLEFDHPYIDIFSLSLMLLFASVLYFFSGKFSSKYPPAIIITLLLILFIQLRTCVLIVLPDSLLHSANVSNEMFNVTLGYMIIGTIACYFGLALGYGAKGGVCPQNFSKNSHHDDFQIRFLSVAFVLSLILSMIIYYTLDYVGATGDGSHLGFFQRYIARLISPIGWLMMFMAAYALHSSKATHTRLFLALLVLYFLSLTLSGSRSGIFEIIILLLSYKLIIDGNFSIKLSGWRIVLLIFLVPLSLVVYQISTQLRAHWYGADLSIASAIDSSLAPENDVLAFKTLISGVSYRLSFLEPTMFPIFAQDLGLNDVTELVNVNTTLLSSINRLIPGKPLGDILFTEYAYGYIYNAQEGVLAYAESGRVDHVSYEWTIFGIAYQLFGFLGGVMFIFGLTALLARIIRKFNRRSDFYGLSCSIFFMGILSVWVRNLGIDNLIDRTAHGLVILFICFAVYWTVMSLLRPSGYRIHGAAR